MGMIRSRLARALVLDGLVTFAVGVVAVVGSHFAGRMQGAAVGPLGYGLIGVGVASLLARRVWPRATLAVSVAASAAYLATGNPPGPIFLAPAIAMYSLAARTTARRSLAACGIAFVVLIAGHLPTVLGLTGSELFERGPGSLAWAVGWMVLPWAVGTAVRLGREEAMRGREEEARDRVYEERLRVARDIHDVVGHGLAVINMQAGVALHVLGKRPDADRGPDQVQAALVAIKDASKDALDELRGTLAVFRRPDDGAPRRPMPGLDQLDTLVADMSESGLPVSLDVSGRRAKVSGGVDLAAYRIVQESLTNVLRHAGPATATVRVAYGPRELSLEVVDDGKGSAPEAVANGGHGIVGMRERAAAVGGTLDAGPRPGGGFRVHAVLPVEAVKA